MASFYVIRGRDQGKHFPLRGTAVSIGRDAQNDIQLRDTEVSRCHARIHVENDQFQLVDLQSSNGTFVNGSRVDAKTLRSGDRLQIGRTLMIFTGGVEPQSVAGNYGVDIVRAEPVELSSIRRSLSFQSSGSVSPKVTDPAASPGASHDWELVYLISQAISRTLDVDLLLTQILDLIFQSIQCDRGCIMLVDEESGQLQPASRKNRKPNSRQDRIEISKTILDFVIEHKEGVLTSNACNDERWDAAISIVQAGIREAICVPMQGRYGLVGAIYIDTTRSAGDFVESGQSNRFTDDHLRLMVTIGHQAALAIEDTSYYRAMVQSERLAAMGQTIATLSHHIKNILQGIRGGSYLVDEGLKQNSHDVIKRGWRIVEKNQDRISSLVMDMLTFSKERKPELQPGDIRETIQDTVELLQLRAKEAKVDLQWNPPTSFPLVQFDSEAMHRAILNVIGNAIDATEGNEQGVVRVELSLDTERDLARIAVIDNGSGIKPEDIGKIFSVFESRKGSRGTGLGLPVSQKILLEHRGEIQVTSQEGKGTTFALVWPAGSTRVSIDSSASPTIA